jgi:hypothetical protein
MARSSKITFVSVGTTDQELLPPAPNRVALIITGGNPGRVTFTTDAPAVLDNGLTIVQQSGPLDLWVERHGLVVTSAWRAIAAVAATVVGIVETMEG